MSEIEQKPDIINIPINWHVPDNIQSQYATNVIVQAGQHEFFISFFEVKLPPFVGKPEEIMSHFQRLGYIQADCVGRIIMSVEEIQNFINALQTSLDAYRSTQSDESKE